MNMADVSRAEHAGPADAAPARWRVLPLNRSLGEHRAVWDRLNDERFGSHPMLTADFVDGLLSHFGRGDEQLCVLGNLHSPEAMGIYRRDGAGRWSSFLPSQAQIAPALIADGRQLERLPESLPGTAWQVDHLGIDPLLCILPVSRRLTMRWHRALTMRIALEGGFDAYWSARPDELRQNLRRCEDRALAEDGPVRHVRYSSPEDVGKAVDRYGELESRGWKGRQGTALHPDNGQGRFYRELLQHRASSGGAEVHELWIGERLAASRLLAVGRACIVALKTTYDESMPKLAPGRLLMRTVIADVFERHAGKSFEFYTDVNRDQAAWATNLRPIRNVRQYRHVVAMLGLLGLRRAKDVLRPSASTGGLAVQAFDKVSDLPRGALALLSQASRAHGVELSADWLDLQMKHIFASPADARVMVLSRGDDTLAVLPVVRTAPDSPTVESLGNYYTAINPPVLAPGISVEDLTGLLREIRSRWPRTSQLNFGPIDPECHEFGLLRLALERAGLVPFRYFRFGRWSLPSSGLDYETYFAGRDGATRNTVLRMGRKFERQGGRLEIIEHGERVEAGLAAYEQVYDVSWKKAEPYPDFIRDLVRRCAAQGWLRLGVAWLGEVPVAAQIWIVAHGRAAIFKLAYDEQHKALSAGSLLTCALMRHALDVDHVGEVDYLMGDDAYKRNWMSRRDERWGIVAFDPVTLGGFAGLVRQTLSNARRHLRRKD